MFCKYIVKDISNNIFLWIEKYNQDELMGTNIYVSSLPVGSIDIQITPFLVKSGTLKIYFLYKK